MGDIETGPAEPLGPADMDDALALVAEAGWNQTAADWALMMEHGHCIGFRDAGGRVVASALALPMGGRCGWISMVLVTRAFRRRGLATHLVNECTAWLEDRGITPLLDATPDGALVYARMGFTGLLGITRWQRAGDGQDASVRQPAHKPDLDALARYDAAVFGAERGFILADLARRGPVAGDGEHGFLLGRRGRLATQIGPVSADGEKMAIDLLEEGLASLGGPVFIDTFDTQEGFVRHLEKRGFTRQRTYTRMIRGKALAFGDAARGFATAGPELG